MKTLLIIMSLVFVSCGGSDGGGASSDTPSTEISAQGEEKGPKNQSITLASASDLPDCDEAIDKQLAYILDEEVFYLCEKNEWVEISIKGKDGRDGENGVDGVTTEVEATNKENQWVDPVSGDSWLIGGSGTYTTALATCTGSYRIPTEAEAYAAMNRGLMLITSGIAAGQTFWLDQVSGATTYVAYLNSNVPSKTLVNMSSSYAIYCVK